MIVRRPGRALLAVASWAHDRTAVRLNIEWDRIGLDKRSAVIRAEAIERFQEALTFAPEDGLVVELITRIQRSNTRRLASAKDPACIR